MPRKLTDEEIKIYVENNNYKLINIHREDKIFIEVECPNSHIYKTSWNNFKSGSRCMKCRVNNSRLSFDYVKNFIEVESNSDCELLSDIYIDNTKLLTIKCKCSNKFYTTFGNFQQGKRQCNECGIKIRSDKKRLSYEEVKTYIESIEGYKLLSKKYYGIDKYLKILCPYGHEFKMAFGNFKYGGERCSVCAGRQKTIENIYNIINIEGYQLLTKLTKTPKNIDKLEIKCPVGHIFHMSYSKFQQGHRCGECNNHFMHKDTEYFKNEVYQLVGDEYSVLGEYEKATIKTKIKHNICGYEWDITPDNFLSSGRRCPMCQHRSWAKTTEEFKQEVFDLVGDEYIVLGEYTKNDIDIKMFHNECKKEFYIRPANFLYGGNRCSHCKKSKGENKINEVFIDNNWIEISQEDFDNLNDKNKYNKKYFIPQKKFEGLKGTGGRVLSYDFYVPKLNHLIEYDGEFHYKVIKIKDEPIECAEERLRKQQIHDRLKNEYAKNNKINLLRIPYWDFDNIEKILLKELVLD